MIITEKDLNQPKKLTIDKTDFSSREPMSIEEENEWTSQLIDNLAKMEQTKTPFIPFPPLPAGKRPANR